MNHYHFHSNLHVCRVIVFIKEKNEDKYIYFFSSKETNLKYLSLEKLLCSLG